MQVKFHDTSSSELSLDEVIQSIKKFLENDKKSLYTLTIGTDSELKKDTKKKTLELVTAIVIYRKGFGGRYFWSKKEMDSVKTLRDKIYQEVLLSVEMAHELLPRLKEKLNGTSSKYNLEIHIDVGEKGETREMIREVVGIVTGNGFVAKTKPYSYAASNIADRHT